MGRKHFDCTEVHAQQRVIVYRDALKSDPLEGMRLVEFIGSTACITYKGQQSRLNDLKLIRKTITTFTYSLTYFGSKVYFTTDYDAKL